jgi:hypothetical protein
MLVEFTDVTMTVQHKRRLGIAGALDSKPHQNGSQRVEVRTKVYADLPKRRTTNDNANVRTDILQVTKDKCIERQEEMNCRIGLQMATKADRPIMIWS